MIHKLIIICNPCSSHYVDVQREVLAPARRLKGWLVGKYELKPTDVDDNAKELAKLLDDGDLAVAVGGDGTAAVAVNGIMQSGKDVTFSALGYGNFNDVARMLGAKRPVEYGGEYVGGITEIVQRFENEQIAEVYPLEAKVDGKLWRYAPCYITLGMFAESAAVLNSDGVRKKLRTGKKRLFFSLWQLAKWYFANRKREFLPGAEVKSEESKAVKKSKAIVKSKKVKSKLPKEEPEIIIDGVAKMREEKSEDVEV